FSRDWSSDVCSSDLRVTSVKKCRATSADCIPVRLPGAERQVLLQVPEASARPRNDFITKFPVIHENWLFPVELEANLDHRTHWICLSVKPRENPLGLLPYHSVQSRALTIGSPVGPIIPSRMN